MLKSQAHTINTQLSRKALQQAMQRFPAKTEAVLVKVACLIFTQHANCILSVRYP